MTSIITEDGTWLIHDPEIGVISGRTRQEAQFEIARRKAALSGSLAGMALLLFRTTRRRG